MPVRRSDFEGGRSVLAEAARCEGLVLFEHPYPAPRPRPGGETLLERFTAAYEAQPGPDKAGARAVTAARSLEAD